MLAQMARLLFKLLAALLVIVVAGLATFYIVDGHPLAESAGYLEGTGYIAEGRSDGGWLFQSDTPNGRGLLIMHGALIKPQSYAKTAAFFAKRGYTVLLPYGGATRLPINALDAASDAIRELDLTQWYSIGHSLGGMASLEVIQRNPDLPFVGAALWASGIPADYSAVAVPILFLWGDHDDLLPRSRFEAGQAKLPDSVEYITVAGANHQDFAMYGHQFLDGEGQLGWAQQIDDANRVTLAFFNRVSGGMGPDE